MPLRPVGADRLAVLCTDFSQRITTGPSTKLTNSAVRQAAPERKVM